MTFYTGTGSAKADGSGARGRLPRVGHLSRVPSLLTDCFLLSIHRILGDIRLWKRCILGEIRL